MDTFYIVTASVHHYRAISKLCIVLYQDNVAPSRLSLKVSVVLSSTIPSIHFVVSPHPLYITVTPFM